MKITQSVFYLLAASTTLMTIIFFFQGSSYGIAIASAVVGLSWWGMDFKGWNRLGNACLLFFAYTSLRMIMTYHSQVFALAALCTAILAWDLQQFNSRLKRTPRVLTRQRMMIRHTKQLSVIMLLIAIFCLIALNVKPDIGYIWVLISALAAAVLVGKIGIFSVRQGNGNSDQTENRK